MTADPLAVPSRDSEALGLFAEAFGLRREGPPAELLERTARLFARIPYENLTKIVRLAEAGGTAERARRTPRDVIADHLALGAGGTCFSLTATFLHLLRALGFEAEPILADRRYGENTHCALVVRLDGRPHLLDPGYLIVRPIDLAGGEQRLETEFNEVELTPREGGERLELHTVQQGNRTYRLTFKTAPADAAAFLAAWDASFGWEMMTYPVLTRVAGGRQLYLQERRFQSRGREGVARRELSDAEVLERITADFAVSGELARRALEALRRRGR